MDDTQLIQALERKLDTLLEVLQQLERENKALRTQQAGWQQERAQLVQKSELARTRVEAMIQRLRGLEENS